MMIEKDVTKGRFSRLVLSIGIFVIFSAGIVHSAEYFVATNGKNTNPGTRKRPFGTIQKAADVACPGDVCYVRTGVYRQNVKLHQSGQSDAVIKFAAYGDEKVVLNGTEIFEGEWTVHKGKIYKSRLPRQCKQLFVDGRMMLEARWPNLDFPDGLWTQDRWAKAGIGSRHGKVVDKDLAKTNIDWTGAIAALNVAHQFFTWTRTVEEHGKGKDTFYYTPDLRNFVEKGDKWISGEIWEDDRYFLFGKLEALDCPGEWFYDKDKEMLYIRMPDDGNPSEHTIEIKRRNYGFEAEGISYVELSGFSFFGCAFGFDNCDYLLIDDCHLQFPSHGRHTMEPGHYEDEIRAHIQGNCNIVRDSGFAYGALTGLYLEGSGNLVDNCVVHDFSWYGSLKHIGIRMLSPWQSGKGPSGPWKHGGPVVRHSTIYNTGGPCIQFKGPDNVIEYNYVHDGMSARFGGSLDGSLIYTAGEDCAGSVVRYNWVHSTQPGTVQSTWGQGIGIRGDGGTRRLTVHHNVVWDCGGAGILVKGDRNTVFNNTVLDIGRPGMPVGSYIMLLAAPKRYGEQNGGRQNENSRVYNNAALTITGNWERDKFPEGPTVSHNYCGRDLGLRDIAGLDFRPAKDSPLVDGAKLLSGASYGYVGDAPDIGAYEHGGVYWRPGANWSD